MWRKESGDRKVERRDNRRELREKTGQEREEI
jgi:hypothetical protein